MAPSNPGYLSFLEPGFESRKVEIDAIYVACIKHLPNLLYPLRANLQMSVIERPVGKKELEIGIEPR
jgi:hypothetical protein